MNTGQMMLTAGAMVLLGTTVLTVNRNNLQHGTILRQTELGIFAVSLATSYMEKASGLDFDESSVGTNIVTSTAQLSSPLGTESGETANVDATFDDYDDYHKFDILDTTAIRTVDAFRVKASVAYVDNNYLISSTKSYCKRMDLTVIPLVSRNVFEDTASAKGVDEVKFVYFFSYFQ